MVVTALADGTVKLKPYDLARFLGKLAMESESDFELFGDFLADVDYIDDGHLDAALVEHQIVEKFDDLRPKLVAVARARLTSRGGTQWILETLDAR